MASGNYVQLETPHTRLTSAQQKLVVHFMCLFVCMSCVHCTINLPVCKFMTNRKWITENVMNGRKYCAIFFHYHINNMFAPKAQRNSQLIYNLVFFLQIFFSLNHSIHISKNIECMCPVDRLIWPKLSCTCDFTFTQIKGNSFIEQQNITTF